MPIDVRCACGKNLKAKDELAGKRVRCPSCKAVMTLAAPIADAEDEALGVLMSDPDPNERQASTNFREVDPEPPPPPRPQSITAAPRLPPAPVKVEKKPKPKAKKRAKREGYSGVAFEEGWFGSVNSGAVGGILMMVIAVVWFVGGWMAGRIFFYPPILFVIGFIALVKGIFGGE
jgi:hypothetical protein